MVTTAFARSTFPPAARPALGPFTWRFNEAFWPDRSMPCGLDAAAARLLRSALTLAVEQMLAAHREQGAPLPPHGSLEQVSQPRFDPLAVHWNKRREEVRALLATEVRMTLALLQRVADTAESARWADALIAQCRRIGGLYQALVRLVGNAHALAALVEALKVGVIPPPPGAAPRAQPACPPLSYWMPYRWRAGARQRTHPPYTRGCSAARPG